MSVQSLPSNEPLTDFTIPAVRDRLADSLARIKDKTEDIPIVIGGNEFRTSDVKYQVCVSMLSMKNNLRACSYELA